MKLLCQKLQVRHEYMSKPYKFELEVKGKVELGSLMYAIHPLMVIDTCVKYGKPMQKQEKNTLRTGHRDMSNIIYLYQ